MSVRLSEASLWIEADRCGADDCFSTVSTDSRKIRAGDLYVALHGERFDGHAFIAQAEAAGAVACVTDREVSCDIPVLRTGDTRLALGKLAAGWRWRLGIPVVGITGSNGKTTAKEMTAAILRQCEPVYSTHGNFNNEIGVPLSLLAMQPEHRVGVIEMGASHAGDIAYTAAFAQHDIAILTNAGAAHLEGFGSIEGVAQAKGEIISSLPQRGVAILNADDAFYDYWLEIAGPRKVISFGMSLEADFRAADVHTTLQEDGFHTDFTMHYLEQSWPVRLHLAGQHNVMNALAAAAASWTLGATVSDIQAGLAELQSVKGRLQVRRASSGGVIIDDSYNGNPSSLDVALSLLSSLQDKRCLVALGSFAELGADSDSLHQQVGLRAKQAGIDKLFLTGASREVTAAGFGAGAYCFDSKEELIQALNDEMDEGVILLVKGSRSQGMEHIVEALAMTGGHA